MIANLTVSRRNFPASGRTHLAWLLVLSLGFLCGCGAPTLSYPKRSTVEQMLISRASDRVMDGVDLAWANGRKIYVEEKYFDAYDRAYAIGMIRQRLSQNGAMLVVSNNQADIVVEIRSAGLSVNNSSSLLGIPSIPIPNLMAGSLQTPELALYKSEKADALGEFVLFAYTRDTGKFYDVSGPSVGRAHYYIYKIIGITLKRTDVPELKKPPKKNH